MSDFYTLLGVQRSASQGDIKAAFRKAALEHHPDKHVHEGAGLRELSSQRFKAISEAYQTLGNEAKRRTYDLSGRLGGARSGSTGQYQQYQGQQHPFYRAQASTSGSAYRAPQGFARRSFWSAFKLFTRGMTRGDAYFHMLLAGCVIGGTLVSQSVGSSLWESHNRGKSFDDILLKKKAQEAAASATRAAPIGMPRHQDSALPGVGKAEAATPEVSRHAGDADAEQRSQSGFSTVHREPAAQQASDTDASDARSVDAAVHDMPDGAQSAAGCAAAPGVDARPAGSDSSSPMRVCDTTSKPLQMSPRAKDDQISVVAEQQSASQAPPSGGAQDESTQLVFRRDTEHSR